MALKQAPNVAGDGIETTGQYGSEIAIKADPASPSAITFGVDGMSISGSELPHLNIGDQTSTPYTLTSAAISGNRAFSFAQIDEFGSPGAILDVNIDSPVDTTSPVTRTIYNDPTTGIRPIRFILPNVGNKYVNPGEHIEVTYLPGAGWFLGRSQMIGAKPGLNPGDVGFDGGTGDVPRPLWLLDDKSNLTGDGTWRMPRAYDISGVVDFTSAEPDPLTAVDGDAWYNTTSGTASISNQALVNNRLYRWSAAFTAWYEISVAVGTLVYSASNSKVYVKTPSSLVKIGESGATPVRISTNVTNLVPTTYEIDASGGPITLSLFSGVAGRWDFTDPNKTITATNTVTINNAGATFTDPTGVQTLGNFVIDVQVPFFITNTDGTNNYKVTILTGTEIRLIGSGAVPWVANTEFEQGTLIHDVLLGADVLLRVPVTYTSGATLDGTELLNLRLVSQTVPGFFSPSSPVLADMQVFLDGIVYTRLPTGTTGASFSADASNWVRSVDVTAAQPWVASKNVYLNELRSVTMLGAIVVLRSQASRTTGATLNATELGFWDLVSQSKPGTFAATTAAIKDFVILNSGYEYRRDATGTTGATFGATEIASAPWTKIAGIPSSVAFQAGLEIFAGEHRTSTIQGSVVTVRRTTTGTAGASFDATEMADWTYVSQNTTEDFVASGAVIKDTLIKRNGTTFRRKTTGTTAASFSTAELANWDVISRGESVQDITASTAISAQPHTTKFLFVDASAGAVIVTLPLAADSAQMRVYVKKMDSSANTVTVSRSAPNTIDGITSFVISNQYDSFVYQPNAAGTVWGVF
jgi:hypothetical protein